MLSDYESESQEMQTKGVDLTPELWVRKLF
jgi:hypothetical protein